MEWQTYLFSGRRTYVHGVQRCYVLAGATVVLASLVRQLMKKGKWKKEQRKQQKERTRRTFAKLRCFFDAEKRGVCM